jgi:hypothetical protein
MERVPEFSETFPEAPPRRSKRAVVSVAKWVVDIRQAYLSKGFAGVHQAAREALATIESPSAYHCMARHVLESIARIAFLAPQYDAMAKTKGLAKMPSSVSWRLIELHLLSFPATALLDALAAPIQEGNVPILCQDVPPIDIAPVLSNHSTPDAR